MKMSDWTFLQIATNPYTNKLSLKQLDMYFIGFVTFWKFKVFKGASRKNT